MRPGDGDPDDLLDAEGRGGPKPGLDAQALALLNHDLRNALTSIVSAVHILRLQGYVNPVAEQAGRTIERQAEHLALVADPLSEAAGVPPARRDGAGPKEASVADRLDETRPRRVLV